jgi:hypothetical protein
MSNVIENLDFYCVDYAQRVADQLMHRDDRVPGDDVAQTVTRLLSILHENGVYGALLYVVWKRYNGTRRERQVASVIEDLLVGKPGELSLLRLEQMSFSLSESKDTLAVGKTLSLSLEELFMAKDVLNRTLTYLRYHAKTGNDIS